jgi:nucleotide-binding universal stress UspA family protein
LGTKMTYRDILLPVLTYPDPPSPGPIGAAFGLAKQFGASVTAMLLDLDAHRSAWPSSLGTSIAGISDLIGGALAQSHANSRETVKKIEAEASRSQVIVNVVHEPTTIFPSASPIVERARLHDLTIMPTTWGFERWFSEAVIFGSGSPVLLLPDERNSLSLDIVVVAWDFSLAAARALRASLPLLSAAGKVRIFTVANEKESTAGRTIDDLQRHLSAHKVPFIFDEVDIAGRNIGDAFRTYTQSTRADMLVMGAFGHSRVREFVLGGATQSMLTNSNLPVLLAH